MRELTMSMKSMPKVVPDQKASFESNELFRRLSREAEVKYTGYRDRPPEERQMRFHSNCQAGRSEIAFVTTGMNLSLSFFNWDCDYVPGQLPTKEFVNFDQESGKVFLKSPFIMNGVCVVWKGWINLNKLDGMGKIEFDEEHARNYKHHSSNGGAPAHNKQTRH